MAKHHISLSRIQRLTFSRGLLIAVGTLLVGAALGWVNPPPCVIGGVGVFGLILVALGLLTLDADPCDGHLRDVKPNAIHLSQNLANFDGFWWAFEKDELLDGTHMSCAEAMDQLLFRFTRFFSAAWIYESHCREHRLHEEVVDRLREVYRALGEPRKGCSDERVMSGQLHAIGEAGMNNWGTSTVGFKSRREVQAAMSGDEFDPLRRLLKTAHPDSDARVRLESTLQALHRLQQHLSEKGY
jgi:hypothetical protein